MTQITRRVPNYDADLADHELRALKALARADSRAHAAKLLGITDDNLSRTLGRAYLKLGVRNQTVAFRVLGWLRPPTI